MGPWVMPSNVPGLYRTVIVWLNMCGHVIRSSDTCNCANINA